MLSARVDYCALVLSCLVFSLAVSNLSQPGTFAGNDAIVAFARSQQVKVVIHQLNTPLWEVGACEDFHTSASAAAATIIANVSTTCHCAVSLLLITAMLQINGVEKLLCRELHIAYRYGDHYDSVRRIGDNSESPAQLRIEVPPIQCKHQLFRIKYPSPLSVMKLCPLSQCQLTVVFSIHRCF